MKLCGAETTIWGVTCTRNGKHAGRCWQHRHKSSEEAKKGRQEAFAAMEHRVDVSGSREKFIRLALEHGLKAQVTIDAFTEFRRFVFAKT